MLQSYSRINSNKSPWGTACLHAKITLEKFPYLQLASTTRRIFSFHKILLMIQNLKFKITQEENYIIESTIAARTL